eukprot:TRINITY_DN4728_c3_g2_i1.p1 TRINITY_DN4728_c3_g2~~TRINITY_DN4728_c3_g2_i1.p1  ORF type:complete len:464 (+),score=140.94 TRINITY_DN4728_c3_g2_i1:72-1394(+)
MEEEIEFYQYSATKGDPIAQFTVAKTFLKGGYGVEKDVQKAFSMFKMGAETNQDSKAFLGFFYEHGIYVEQNNETALKYYTESSNKNQPKQSSFGQFFLGKAYLYGNIGLEVSHSKAFQLIQGSAFKGNLESNFLLGLIYYNGWGVSKNFEKAFQQFQAASLGEHTLAQYYLGRMYHFGIGTSSENCVSAVHMYKKAAEKSETRREFIEAFELFQDGEIDKALVRYELLAEKGYEIAQSNAAYIFDNYNMIYNKENVIGSIISQYKTTDNTDPDNTVYKKLKVQYTQSELYKIEFLHKAFIYYLRSADQSNSDAHLKLGDYYYYGYGGVEKDFVKAASFYRYASDRKNAQATFNLGYMHQYGIGLDQDFFLSKRYFDTAFETLPSALLPVKLALIGLGIHYLSTLFLVEDTFYGYHWDSVIVAILAILLSFTLLVRQLIR